MMYNLFSNKGEVTVFKYTLVMTKENNVFKRDFWLSYVKGFYWEYDDSTIGNTNCILVLYFTINSFYHYLVRDLNFVQRNTIKWKR